MAHGHGHTHGQTDHKSTTGKMPPMEVRAEGGNRRRKRDSKPATPDSGVRPGNEPDEPDMPDLMDDDSDAKWNRHNTGGE